MKNSIKMAVAATAAAGLVVGGSPIVGAQTTETSTVTADKVMSQTFAYSPSLTDGGLMYPNGAFGQSYDNLTWEPGSADKIKSMIDTMVKDEASVSAGRAPGSFVPAAGPMLNDHIETNIGDLRDRYGDSLNVPANLPNECKAYTASVRDFVWFDPNRDQPMPQAGEFEFTPPGVQFDASWTDGIGVPSFKDFDDAQRAEFSERLISEYGKLVDLFFERWGSLGRTDPQAIKDRFTPTWKLANTRWGEYPVLYGGHLEEFRQLAALYNKPLPAEDIFVPEQVVITKDSLYPGQLAETLMAGENPKYTSPRDFFAFNSDSGMYYVNIAEKFPTHSTEVDNGTNVTRATPVIGESVLWDPTDPSCFVPSPAIDIEKYINGEDADEAPGVAVKPGEDMAIRFDVTNTGNVPLEMVVLRDDKVSYEDIKCEPIPQLKAPEPVPGTDEDGAKDLARTLIGFMPVGSKTSCTATFKAPESGEHVNTGTVMGVDSDGTYVGDADEAHATVETPATTPETEEPVVEETTTPAPVTTETAVEETTTQTTTIEPTPVTETQVVTTTVLGTPVTETVVVAKEPEVVHVTDTVKVTEEVVTVKDGVTTTQTVVRDVPAVDAPTTTPAPAPETKRVALAVTGAETATVSLLGVVLLGLAGLSLALRRKA